MRKRGGERGIWEAATVWWIAVLVTLMIVGLIYWAIRQNELYLYCRELGYDDAVWTHDGGECIEYHPIIRRTP